MLELDVHSLQRAYAHGSLTPSDVVATVYDRLDSRDGDGVWISVVSRNEALGRARELDALSRRDRDALPLFGLPFSVKDCIDVAGLPTTAGCPDFAYTAETTNLAVARALDTGAILVGKTNLDQFATGLAGVRTPYGVARNPFGAELIPGGSSSGAAVSVASGQVAFAFGTDTGGSGRVPAGFNNIVGLKPTLGLLSRTGMTGACRSLDTLSIFAQTAASALKVLEVCTARDPGDAYGRSPPESATPVYRHDMPFTFAVPSENQLQFFGNREAERLFGDALQVLRHMGGTEVSVDYAPFLAVNDLLFNGPWVAERLVAIGSFIYEKPRSLHPVTREVILGAEQHSAADFAQAMYRLKELQARTAEVFEAIDVMVVPTTGTVYRISEVESDPITLNANLGYYTNFVNFLDLAAVAVPNGFLPGGAPMGITVIGRAFTDACLAGLAGAFHDRRCIRRGAFDGARSSSFDRSALAR